MIGGQQAEVELIPPAIRDQSCRLCGQRRGRDEPDAAWTVDLAHDFRSRAQLKVRRDADGTEHYSAPEKPWSRRHTACQPTSWWVLEQVTGLDVRDDDLAREVLRKHKRSVLAGDRQVATRRPWDHVAEAERQQLRAILAELTAPTQPYQSELGRCGLCGVSESEQWSTIAGISWAVDGRQAPLCARCTAVLPAPGGDVDRDRLRLRAIGLLAGMRVTAVLGQHRAYGMKLAAEVLTTDERNAAGQDAWTYRPSKLREVRSAVREAWPELLLDPAERAAGVERLLHRRAFAAQASRQREAERTVGAGADW